MEAHDVYGAVEGVREGTDLGTRETFADLGATVEEALLGKHAGPGKSFLRELLAVRAR